MPKTAAQQIKEAQERCPKCNGRGMVTDREASKGFEKRCELCKGTGKAKPKKGNKYHTGTKEERTYNRVTYHSVLEARVAKWLALRMGTVCPRCLGAKFRKKGILPSKSPKNKGCKFCDFTGRIGGDVLSWERQVKFDLWVTSVYTDVPSNRYPYPISIPLANDKGRKYQYVCDFVVHYTNGTTVYIEVKGYWTQLAKLKWAIFRANNPNLKVRVITKEDIPDGF